MTHQRLLSAFPSSCQADVLAACRVIDTGFYGVSVHNVGDVYVHGEPVYLPMRVGGGVHGHVGALTPTQRVIVDCIMTRHHDGFVRQRHLQRVLASPHSWSVPFVVQLMGEYVLEILNDIERGVSEDHKHLYAQFIHENPSFFELTSQRMISYWNCYHRYTYPDRQSYVGSRLMRLVRAWASV